MKKEKKFHKFWRKFKAILGKPHCWYIVVALLSIVEVYFYIKEGKELPAILWTICSAVYIVLAWMYYKAFK